jgi:hypothetical protein
VFIAERLARLVPAVQDTLEEVFEATKQPTLPTVVPAAQQVVGLPAEGARIGAPQHLQVKTRKLTGGPMQQSEKKNVLHRNSVHSTNSMHSTNRMCFLIWEIKQFLGILPAAAIVLVARRFGGGGHVL